VVGSFDPYFVGKIVGALSLVRFESSKKVVNLIFVKTSNGHNFCSGYQNDYYYICIWDRKKFPISWQPAKGWLRSLASQNHMFTSFFYFSSFIVLFF